RYHKDLYLCHFYVPDRFTKEIPVWHDQVYLIDLHRLRHQRFTWPIAQIKDLAQLLFSSSVAGVDDRDRLRFWCSYLGPERQSWWAELLLWCILFKCRRYTRHEARRRKSLVSSLPTPQPARRQASFLPSLPLRGSAEGDRLGGERA